MSSSEIFTDIYQREVWGSGSGGGSTPEYLGAYIALVEWLIKVCRPATVLDIGCGVGWIANRINWQDCLYIGIDVVRDVVEQARPRISGEVYVLDAITDTLPPADLVLLKEVTQHLDNASITTIIEKLRSYPLVLHCSAWREEVNQEISTGGFRSVDLSKPPFSLPCETLLQYEVGESRYMCQLWRTHGI